MEYLFVIAGAIALLFFFIIVFNKRNQTAQWLLATLCLLVVINCYYVFLLYKSDGRYYEAVFSEINYAIPLLYGVLLWFYARSLIHESLLLRWSDILHFMPFILFIGFLSYPLISGINSAAAENLGYPNIKLIISPIYFVLTLLTLRQHRKRLLNEFSYIDHMRHFWLNWVAYGGFVLWLVAVLGYIYNWSNNYTTTILPDYLLISFLAVFLFILAYIGFNRTHIFQPNSIADKDVEELKAEIDKKDDDQNLDEEFNSLKGIMEKEKPFLDPKLSLSRLAEISQLPTAKLSQVINTSANQNFFEFVNSYRVEEVKARLDQADLNTYSILGIAEESGFNSKASFNRIFKNHTGMTPSQYISKTK